MAIFKRPIDPTPAVVLTRGDVLAMAANEEAAAAGQWKLGDAAQVVRARCGSCSEEMSQTEFDRHRCKLTPKQQARYDVAMRERAAVKAAAAAPYPCPECSKEITAASTHWCMPETPNFGRRDPAEEIVTMLKQSGYKITKDDGSLA